MELPEPDPMCCIFNVRPRWALICFISAIPGMHIRISKSQLKKEKRKINKMHIDFITISRGGISGGRRQEGNQRAPTAGQSGRRFGHFCQSTVYQFLHKTPIQHLHVPRLRLDRRLMLRSLLLLPPKWKVKFPSSPPEARALSWQVTASAGQTLKFQIKKIRTNWHKIRTVLNFIPRLRMNPDVNFDWIWSIKRNYSWPPPRQTASVVEAIQVC